MKFLAVSWELKDESLREILLNFRRTFRQSLAKLLRQSLAKLLRQSLAKLLPELRSGGITGITLLPTS